VKRAIKHFNTVLLEVAKVNRLVIEAGKPSTIQLATGLY
jgi:hypothetical protein